MKHRSALLSAVALAATALLVSVGGAAYADNIVVDGDALTTPIQTDIDFGIVACGSVTTQQVAVYVQSNGHQGSGQQVFENGTSVDVSATTSAPLSVSVAAGEAGDIDVPDTWEGTSAYPNNTLTPTGATATVSLLAGSIPGPYTGTVAFSGTGASANGGSIVVGPLSKTARWTVATCQTDTTTTLTCPVSVIYTGTAIAPCTATVTGTGGFSQTLSVGYANNTAVGTVTASAAFAGDATRKASSGTATFEITKAPSTTTVDCPESVTFTGSPLAPCIASVSGVGGLDLSLTPTYADHTNAGTATASASFAGDANHTGSDDAATFEILAAAATCSVTGFAGDYDGEAHGALGSCTGLGGADLSAGLQFGDSFTDVPGGTANWTFTFPNYASQSGSAGIIIDKAASSVSLVCSDTVYTGAAQETCTATVTRVGGLTADVPVTYSDNINAGTASASATYLGDANHKPSQASDTFDIAKATSATEVTCTVPNTYTGGELTPCTAKVTGAGGLDQTFTPTYLNNTNAGTASASYAFAGDANHETSDDTTTFTIDKASSSINLTCPASVVFTGDPHTPCTATVSAVALVDFAVGVTYGGNTNAGNATAAASWGGDANHVGSTANGGFVITKAPSSVVVTCPTPAIPFTGSPIEPCSAWVTGAGGLDQAVIPVIYAGNTLAGTATASATFGGDANHLGSVGSATFRIDPWTLTGFYKPVDMLPTILNIVKGGSTVPLKFTVFAGTSEVTDLVKLNAIFVVKGASCDPTDLVSDDLLTTTGNTTLRYDATAHQWIQNWQTPKTAGKCYTVVLTTSDGTTLSAQFKTK